MPIIHNRGNTQCISSLEAIWAKAISYFGSAPHTRRALYRQHARTGTRLPPRCPTLREVGWGELHEVGWEEWVRRYGGLALCIMYIRHSYREKLILPGNISKYDSVLGFKLL